MKKQGGITLIALVITIIVLIILAGVAINLSLGENGIVTKAKYAKELYLNEQTLEAEKINELTNELEGLTGSTIIVQKYKIKYNLNEGTGNFDEQIKEEDISIILNTSIPVREGYIFKGWQSSNSETIYQPGDVYDKNVDDTLNAIWQQKLSISLDKNITDNNQTNCTSLKATITPTVNSDSATITWSSSNSSVATVDSSGVVTGKGTGTTTITATTTAADGSTATADVNITINSNTSTTKCTGTNYTSGSSGDWRRYCTNPQGLHSRSDGWPNNLLASSGNDSCPSGWTSNTACSTSKSVTTYVME